MDPISLLALGGASLGGQVAGTYLSSQQKRKAAEEMQKYLQAQYQEAKDLLGTATRTERERILEQYKTAEQRTAETERRMEFEAQREALSTFGSPAYQNYAGYVQQMFQQGLPTSLEQTYAGKIRSAQAARGLESGGAPATQEALTLTNLAEQYRQQLLPQLRQVAMDPSQFLQQARAAQLQQAGAAQGVGFSPYQQFVGGIQAAQGVANQQAQPIISAGLNSAQQYPVSSASPLADLVYGAGTGLQGLLGLLALTGGGNKAAAAQGGTVAAPGVPSDIREYLASINAANVGY